MLGSTNTSSRIVPPPVGFFSCQASSLTGRGRLRAEGPNMAISTSVSNSKSKLIVSNEDADLLIYKWQLNRRGYASRATTIAASSPRKTRHFVAHRVVLERMVGRPLTPLNIADHINGDRLDNRRENLRLTDRFGNAQNRGVSRNKKSSRFRGVSFHTGVNKWRAKVTHCGHQHHCGFYTLESDAAAAAKKKRIEFGFLGETPIGETP